MEKEIYLRKKIQQLIKKGFGQGAGRDYKPFLHIGDFASKGRGHRVYGVKTQRVHHLFSDAELRYFYLLEWDDNVIDIREQYPLFYGDESEKISEQIHCLKGKNDEQEIIGTERIAYNRGIEHPTYSQTDIPVVMTTDFLYLFNYSSCTSISRIIITRT